ncbi:MAG TPA: STAS domain-containing protein, partial [Burkholderiaceae bacterium]|nr:STAS domain-containing protein [Burkholderiaceae bacterium]
PVIESMPQATLAALVVAYSSRLIQPGEFRAIVRIRRTEFIWAVVAFAGVVLLGTLKGIEVGIIVSLIALCYQAANPPVHVLGRKPGTNFFRPLSSEHPEDETFPGLLILRTEGRVFFFNAERIGDKIKTLIGKTRPTIVAMDFSGVSDLEYSALKMLTEGEKKYRERGVLLWLVSLEPAVLAVVQRSPLGQALGRDRMLFTLEQAVAKHQARFAQSTAP